jgi:hypothetical protein
MRRRIVVFLAADAVFHAPKAGAVRPDQQIEAMGVRQLVVSIPGNGFADLQIG